MAVDLSTSYLGFKLRSPIVASAGPVTGDRTMWERLANAGVGAIVLPSLFEEQIEQEAAALDFVEASTSDTFGEALDFLPGIGEIEVGPARHLSLVEAASDFFDVPVIASINGTSPGGWVAYAKYLAEAGAAAIELNVYDVVVDPELSSSAVEARLLELVGDVRKAIKVPLSVKIGPNFTAPVHFIKALQSAGVDGVVIFNRFYQPEIDLDSMRVEPKLHLSTSADISLRATWLGILHEQVYLSLGATGGVHTADDVIRLLLSGANCVMTTAAMLRNGPEVVAMLHDGLTEWMEEHEYESVEQMIGSVSRAKGRDPHAYERANYMRTILSWGSR